MPPSPIGLGDELYRVAHSWPEHLQLALSKERQGQGSLSGGHLAPSGVGWGGGGLVA